MTDDPAAPILRDKRHAAASVFTPGNILRQARRQKGLASQAVPEVCVLDPDGDIVRHLKRSGRARQDAAWPATSAMLSGRPDADHPDTTTQKG